MEQRLSLVTLGVDDPMRARAFYEALGWRPQPSPDGVVFFQLNGMALALWGRGELAGDAGLPPATGWGGIALAYNARTADEVDAVLAQATEAGATLLKPAHETFWGGYAGYFADPDGHPWEVAHNPFWRIAADGSVDITG